MLRIALDEFVERENLSKEKLVSFSSDGASVMRSERRGVSGHLRRNYNPSIFHSTALYIDRHWQLKMDLINFQVKSTKP